MIVKSSPAFSRAVRRLDRSEQILVLKTVEQLKTYDSMAGKVLRGALHGCRSIRTGHHNRLRIVFSARTSEILQLIVVGPRERGMVYIQAIQVLKELEM